MQVGEGGQMQSHISSVNSHQQNLQQKNAKNKSQLAYAAASGDYSGAAQEIMYDQNGNIIENFLQNDISDGKNSAHFQGDGN